MAADSHCKVFVATTALIALSGDGGGGEDKREKSKERRDE
jgi:hypothetical protein